MIYACVNTKGGVGKTTNAVHLAAMLARTAPTLLIDGDPQMSAAAWAAMRREAKREPSPSTICLTGRAILQEGSKVAASYAHAVVDAGGRDSVGLRSSLALADRVIIPVGASNLDAWAMTDVLEVIEEARAINEKLDVRVLLTRVDTRSRDTAEMLKFIAEHQLPLLDARICERVAYRRSVGEGAIVPELGKDPAAIAEIEAFFREVTA